MLLRNQAYQSFTRHLLTRHIAPGQFVSQRELVELTGLPLGAIREMIPRLEADGLIRTVPHRGLQVMSVEIGLVRNAFQLRQVLEREAIHSYIRVAPDVEIASLRRKHQAARAAAANDGVTPALLDRAQKMDWAMHDRFIETLNNDLISTIYQTNSIKIRLIRNEDTRMLPELLVSVMDEHLVLLDALLSRDADAAEQALIFHLDSAKQRAVRI